MGEVARRAVPQHSHMPKELRVEQHSLESQLRTGLDSGKSGGRRLGQAQANAADMAALAQGSVSHFITMTFLL